MLEIEFSEVKHKVVSQDYIIMGKQAKETEIKIHCDFGNPLDVKHRIDVAVKAAAYANYRYNGGEVGPESAWEEVKNVNNEKVVASP